MQIDNVFKNIRRKLLKKRPVDGVLPSALDSQMRTLDDEHDEDDEDDHESDGDVDDFDDDGNAFDNF